mgnify:FL=1
MPAQGTMNTRRLFFFLFFILFGALLVAGSFSLLKPPSREKASLTPLSIAFDWTPNTNHTGIYVALAKNWYAEEGIDLKILPYSDSVSTDVLVNAGTVDLGISSTEAITADMAAGAPVVSVAAIIAHNTSSLAVLKDSDITRPAQLEGKIYGGYGAPFEEPVIGTMIRTDGGTGAFENVTLNMDPLEALRTKRIDFSWIFDAWQGVAAKRAGVVLTTFPINQYGIPDYSTPDIITSPDTLKEKKDALKRFMKATARGYEYARTHPRESAQMLIDAAPAGTFPDEGLVFESQEYLSPRYADIGKPWGVQAAASWRDYPAFMIANKAVFDASGKPVSAIDFDSLYTNELFD